MGNKQRVRVLDDQHKREIKDLVCDILEIDPDKVTLVSLFKEEHSADSMSAIEILAVLESKFKISIDQAELNRMVNLDGVYTVVEEAEGQ